MIYLQKENARANTTEESVAAQFEEGGYKRLTRKQIFWEKIVFNAVLDPAIPLVCGALTFSFLGRFGPYGLADFVVAYYIASVVADLLKPLRRWR